MGVFDVFKRQNPIERAVKDLREPFAQPEVRRAAMGKLLEIATDEAYYGLLVRFTFNASGHIADESEKRDLMQELVKVGRPAVDPLKRFIEKEKAISFPLRTLAQIMDREEALEFMTAALKKLEPLDHRTTEQKKALIVAIADLGKPEQAPAVVPYLKDHNDDVQAQAVETLEKLKNVETYSALVEVCVGDAHAARIQRRAAQVLEVLEIPLKAEFEKFNGELRSEYLLTKKGTLAKKSKPAEA